MRAENLASLQRYLRAIATIQLLAESSNGEPALFARRFGLSEGVSASVRAAAKR
jgi:hypothetical protein